MPSKRTKIVFASKKIPAFWCSKCRRTWGIIACKAGSKETVTVSNAPWCPFCEVTPAYKDGIEV